MPGESGITTSGGGIDMIRALSTLAGVALAGGLVWVAAQLHPDHTGGYWAVMGVLAAAGLALALARLPDTGVRTLVPSLHTFVFGFIPALIAAGWVIVATQPHGNWFRRHVLSWSGDIGITRVVRDLEPFAIVLALGVGVVLGLVFQRRVVAESVAEPVSDVPAREPVPADESEADTTLRPRRDRDLVAH
jgi:hypothetical protein